MWSWASSISIVWKLLRNTNSWALPRKYWIQNSGEETQHSGLTSPPGDSQAHERQNHGSLTSLSCEDEIRSCICSATTCISLARITPSVTGCGGMMSECESHVLTLHILAHLWFTLHCENCTLVFTITWVGSLEQPEYQEVEPWVSRVKERVRGSFSCCIISKNLLAMFQGAKTSTRILGYLPPWLYPSLLSSWLAWGCPASSGPLDSSPTDLKLHGLCPVFTSASAGLIKSHQLPIFVAFVDFNTPLWQLLATHLLPRWPKGPPQVAMIVWAHQSCIRFEWPYFPRNPIISYTELFRQQNFLGSVTFCFHRNACLCKVPGT